jgi:hypothetical protein
MCVCEAAPDAGGWGGLVQAQRDAAFKLPQRHLCGPWRSPQQRVLMIGASVEIPVEILQQARFVHQIQVLKLG